MSLASASDTQDYEDKASGGAMLALIPVTSDWCKLEMPHMTLVYAGKVADLDLTLFNELAKDASMLAAITNPLTVRVMGVEQMGGKAMGYDSETVDVLRLQLTPELAAMRRIVESWNKSEFKEFKPHCTIGPHPSYLEFPPRYVAFDRLCASWGKDTVYFRLGQSTRY